jgi:hypothetical protein
MNANPTAGGREDSNTSFVFTRQECKVLDYARKLMTNQEIADKLGVSISRSHLASYKYYQASSLSISRSHLASYKYYQASSLSISRSHLASYKYYQASSLPV